MVHGEPSLSTSQKPVRMNAREVAPPGRSDKKLYLEVLGN